MPKFLGMEPKTYLWVGGGLVALIVVYYVMRSRGGGGGAAAGGEGLMGGGIGGSSPVSYAPYAPDSSGDMYQQQLNDLDIQARQEALREQQAMFELQQEASKQQLGLWGAQQSLLFEGERQEQELRLGYERSAAELANAQIGQTTKEVQSGKIKGECGKGESSAYDRNTGQFFCKKSGKSGIKTIGDTIGTGINDVIAGAGRGAAAGAQAGVQTWVTQYLSPKKGSGVRSSGTSGVDRSTDYGTQHFNVPGNLLG